MKLKAFVVSALSFCLILTGFGLPATASAIGEKGQLIANDKDAQINVRSAPTTQSSSPHYGVAGDQVIVLSEVEGKDGYLWYYVRFQTSQAEGWIRGDLVVLEVSTH